MDNKKDIFYTERQNLLKLLEFAIKETINVSLNEVNFMEIESCEVVQFLAILDSIFIHGVKRSERQCWKFISDFCKNHPDGINIINNIMNIPKIKTNQGRVRAWIRLALMQKTFVDYFTKMIEDRLLLKQYYDLHAFLLNEEASIASGLLISLNFTDFNFCLKEEDLDIQDSAIDVSRYMKLASLETFAPNVQGPCNNGIKDSDQDTISVDSKESIRFTDLLDQKNYLEEMNRHNNSMLNDLREKFKSQTSELLATRGEISRLSLHNSELETANSLLIANFEKCRCCSQSQPDRQASTSTNKATPKTEDNITDIYTSLDSLGLTDNLFVPPSNCTATPYINLDKNEDHGHRNALLMAQRDIQTLTRNLNELKQSLLEEKAFKLKFEHQYDVTLRRNEELEATIKGLEKSERLKHDLVTDLKRQLDDLKAINSEMYTKVENYEASLKHKNELVTRLEQKNKNMGSTITQLEEKYEKLHNYHSSTEDIFGKMERELNKKDQIKMQLENDLKIEREMKISLQHQIQQDKLDFAKRLKEISKAEDILKNNEYLHRKNEELKRKCMDQEQALTELGGQLKESKLQTDDLKDSVLPFVLHSKWQSDKTAIDCLACHKPFSTTIRKHHCRNCGGIFCQDCSNYKGSLSFSSKPVRVCISCHEFLNTIK